MTRCILRLQHILKLGSDSTMYRMVMAQRDDIHKKSWYFKVQNHIKTLDISLQDDDLIKMTKSELQRYLLPKEKEAAFKFLIEKKKLLKTKGVILKYNELRMAPYLTPENPVLNIKQKIFSLKIRTRMINIAANFPNKFPSKMCQLGCNSIEDTNHIYTCNKIENIIKVTQNEVLGDIFGDDILKINSVTKNISDKIEKRSKLLVKPQ